MRWQRCTLVLAGCFSAAILSAQQLTPGPARTALPQPDPADIRFSRDAALSKQFQKRFLHATRRYKLTAEQQLQVRSILRKEQKDTQTVSADAFMSGRDKHEEVGRLYEASQQKIAAVLTVKQRHKFDADEKIRAQEDGRLPWPNPGPPLNF